MIWQLKGLFKYMIYDKWGKFVFFLELWTKTAEKRRHVD